jgi:peptidoglycan/xylan/chitin deacetylase (PgdA/CDA1 family)
MNKYFIQSPFWLPWLYPNYLWKVKSFEKKIYLTFDDGPHPDITLFVLDCLQQYNIKAHFFLIGNNVIKHPKVYTKIVENGHAIGNHTFNHLNGWKTNADEYYNDFLETDKLLKASWFRPPYGRIRKHQATKILPKNKIMMWSKLSADFDITITKEQCLNNCIKKPLLPGEIIVFHDSEKAHQRLTYALPRFIEYALQNGFQFDLVH